MTILLIMILWTWGLTPLWVNIVGSILLGLKWLIASTKDIKEIYSEQQKKKLANMLFK